uniref:CRAL-TRIO domain-containing protein n=2 Tax=Stomoxys calcitrans TaxID=35570 RepID=A0A1I8PFK9_STOCA
MSRLFQFDNPHLNGKMDIPSETTLDSGANSLNENTVIIRLDKERVPFIKNSEYSNHTHLRDATGNSLENYTNDNEEFNKTSSLDNRISRPMEKLTLGNMMDTSSVPQRRNVAARTLADNHPLMLSPTGSETDYNDHEVRLANEKNSESKKNYPDVVPSQEHIRIPQELNPLDENQVSALHTKNVNYDTLTKENNRPEKIKGCIGQTLKPNDLKIAAFRTSSPDLLSSGSEVNISQYQATVDANNQTVALMPKNGQLECNSLVVGNVAGAQNKHLKNARKAEDISSLDSISNHSFDGDEEHHNLASLSPSSSIIDGLDDDDDDDDCEGPELLPDDDDDLRSHGGILTPTPLNRDIGDLSINQLPQYSAAEERRDSRNWQKITLPDGRTRDIDMRVIEPYKRVLSHGGYLKAGGHNAIVIFCACHLPDRSRTDYSYVMDNLFLYVVKTLEQLVTDDYVLIYLHGGSSRRNMPPFPWLKKCYQLLDRRLRKSLKNMYLVHPTFWIKSIIWMTRPFVSTKFWRKLVYVKSLDELSLYVTALEKAAIPEKVKQYDSKKH